MNTKKRTASIIYKVVLIAICLTGLWLASGMAYGHYRMEFLDYFTNLSNMLIGIYFIGSAVALATRRCEGSTWAPWLKYPSMVAITVTFLVAHFLLDGGGVFRDGYFNVSSLILHYIVPIMAIADWLIFDEKGSMKWRDPLIGLAIPFVYAMYVFIRVGAFGISMGGEPLVSRYPYPFIDVDLLGVYGVFVNVIALIVVFAAIGFIYYGIDRLIARRARVDEE